MIDFFGKVTKKPSDIRPGGVSLLSIGYVSRRWMDRMLIYFRVQRYDKEMRFPKFFIVFFWLHLRCSKLSEILLKIRVGFAEKWQEMNKKMVRRCLMI